MKKNKILTITIILLSAIAGTYLTVFQPEKTETLITETKEFIGAANNKVKESSIQDLIVEKPNAEDLVETVELYTAAWIPYWDNRGFSTASENPNMLDSVSPVWFYTNADGTLTWRKSDVEIENRVHQMHIAGVTIIPTVTNPSATELSVIINDSEKRKNHIENIVNVAKENGFDGIDIDYENLDGQDRTAFSTFIKELAESLHKDGAKLTIAVLPKSDNIVYQFSTSRVAQDWAEIGKHVDEFRIMGYDWTHNSTTDAGAISPTYWLEEILAYAIAKIEREKIVIGLPLYGYYWTGNGTTALVWEDVQKEIEQGATTELDASTQENKLTTSIGVSWYQNAESINVRRDIARKFGIKGVVYWRMGGEDPEIWRLE